MDPLKLIDESFAFTRGLRASGTVLLKPPAAGVQAGKPLQLASAVLAGDAVVTLVTEDGDAKGATMPKGATITIGGDLYTVTSAAHRFGKLTVGISPVAVSGYSAGEAVTTGNSTLNVPDAVHLTSDNAPVTLADKGVTFGVQIERQHLPIVPELSGWGIDFEDPRGAHWIGVVIDTTSTESVVLIWVGKGS